MSGIIAAVAVTGTFAALAYALGMVSVSGAVGGLVVGAIIYASLGPQGFAVLALFVIGGSVLTQLGYARKHRAGIAEVQRGRRGAKNAAANCAVAVLLAVLAATTGSAALAAAFVASLGAAFADTTESEIGGLYGRAPRLITTLQTVPPGTDGAVSLPGTVAGLAAAVLTAALGLVLGLIVDPATAYLVALAAFLGTVGDSIIGALTPRIGNEVTNLLCTLIAALITLSLF